MKLIIDIPDRIYKRQGYLNIIDSDILRNALKNGTPLPKGHGRLFDERDIVDGSYEIIGNKIYELDPILEADISGEEQIWKL